jgi:hypothetical protein
MKGLAQPLWQMQKNRNNRIPCERRNIKRGDIRNPIIDANAFVGRKLLCLCHPRTRNINCCDHESLLS